MLLWAKPGKEYKVWTRAFKRFEVEQVDQNNTAWWVANKDNNFVMGLYQSLIPKQNISTELIKTEYTTNV